MDKVQRQIELEEQLRTLAYQKGQSIVTDALRDGKLTELPAGRALLAGAFNTCLESLRTVLAASGAGRLAKYRALLRRVDPEILVVLCLRTLLNACTLKDEHAQIQTILREVGKAIESEAMVACIEAQAKVYLERTIQYLDSGHTQSLNHRRRTLLAAAEHTIGGWVLWTDAEREGAAKQLVSAIWECGLFQWGQERQETHSVQPSPELAQHLSSLEEQARPVLRFEPMIVPPEPWTSYSSGGFLTPWMRVNARLVNTPAVLKEQRDWVIQNIAKADKVIAAVNAAQAVPYRINPKVLRLLQQAMAIPSGVMGLPPHGMSQKPEFPFPDSWEKDKATAVEAETFAAWKRSTAEWYAEQHRRDMKKRGIALAVQSMLQFKEEPELYFVGYVDYRGRLYFRSQHLTPQGSDAVKGCLEFSRGEPLGPDGLFWLKVHVASCAGYDKHDFPLRVQWVDEHMRELEHWFQNPLDTPAPDPSTSFTLYAAFSALREALAAPDPAQYICHVPVAMDATCSGLQHLSALFRDEVGGQYTNLFDSGGDAKQDIYKQVGQYAQEHLSIDDPVVREFWAERPITRSMAKRPTMTYVYGSTLDSNMEYVALDLMEAGVKPIGGTDGKVLYSLYKLSVPVAKGLRAGVEATVPKAAAGMRYFQRLARKAIEPLRWITPVGMPVLNYKEGIVLKKVFIRSMGVKTTLIRRGDGKYNRQSSAEAISPNFVHSMDAAHLAMLVTRCADQGFHVMPIHDSFACLPNHVPEMRRNLQQTFYELYQSDPLEQFSSLTFNKESDKPVPPEHGSLDLAGVLSSRFIFC